MILPNSRYFVPGFTAVNNCKRELLPFPYCDLLMTYLPQLPFQGTLGQSVQVSDPFRQRYRQDKFRSSLRGIRYSSRLHPGSRYRLPEAAACLECHDR